MPDLVLSPLQALATEVRACRACPDLPYGPRPIIQVSDGARILIVGQAPGRRVHDTGVPWNDPSGDRLRMWLGVDRETFYGRDFAIIPTGLCYPGSGARGDYPPPPPGCWRCRGGLRWAHYRRGSTVGSAESVA